MSLINRLEDHVMRGEGRIEVLHSEAEFKEIRSELLQVSLVKLSSDEFESNRNIFKCFSSRRLLELRSTPDNKIGPVFDINDVVQVISSDDLSIGEVLGEKQLFAELIAKFPKVSCGEKVCDLKGLEIDSLVYGAELSPYNVVFVGPLYSRSSDSDQEVQTLLWAFRESRQKGIRRYYIDGEIKSYPSFDSKLVEAEVEGLGSPKMFIPLERSLSVGPDKDEIVKFLNEYVYEHRRVEKRIHCSVFGKIDEVDFKDLMLLPLTGSQYCSRCNLVLNGDIRAGVRSEVYLDNRIGPKVATKKSYSQKVLGYLIHQLNDISIGELVQRTGKEKADYKLPDIFKMLGDIEFKNLKLSESYNSLNYTLKIIMQLALISATKVKGVVFLLEFREDDFLNSKDCIESSLESIRNQGNSIVLHIIGNREVGVDGLHVGSSPTLQENYFSIDSFCELILKNYAGSPLLVDILNLRSKIFEIYLATKQARLKGFFSLSDLSKKEFGCENCMGLGYIRTKLPFGYQAVCECDKCFGTACNIDFHSLTSYGVTLKDCFNGSLKQLSQQFIAEPDFIPIETQAKFIEYGSEFKINTLISDLMLNSRQILKDNILKYAPLGLPLPKCSTF